MLCHHVPLGSQLLSARTLGEQIHDMYASPVGEHLFAEMEGAPVDAGGDR